MTSDYTQAGDVTNQQESEMVNQDYQTEGAQNEVDWEQSAKYFQSEKDKVNSENQKLKTQLDTMGKFLEKNPDLAQTMQQRAQGVGGEQIPVQNAQAMTQIKPEDFDAYESYTDPNSESFKFREMQENTKIEQTVQKRLAGVQQNMAMNQLKTDLTTKGLNQEQVGDFIDFASTPADKLGLDNVINMWKTVRGNNASAPTNIDLTQVRQNQAVPTSPGVMQGQKPQQKPASDKAWEGIMGAKRVGNQIP